MNCTINEAAVKAVHYEILASLSAHMLASVTAYNFAEYLKGYDGGPPSRRSAIAGPETRPVQNQPVASPDSRT